MFKLALAQCDVITGDLEGNADRLLRFCHHAADATLCAAPLEALTGPDCPCLRSQPDFESRAAAAIRRITANLPAGLNLLCGIAPDRRFLLSSCGVREVQPVFELGGLKIGLDLAPEDFGGIQLNISMTSRPYTASSQKEWELGLSGAARQAAIWSASVNLAGGYGSRLYNGQSVIMAPEGVVVARGAAFAEDCVSLDFARPGKGVAAPLASCLQESLWQALSMGLRDFMRKNAGQKALIGLSGGMDSALCACIAASALGPENVTGVLMPSRYTSAESTRDARELAANLGIAHVSVDIEPALAGFQAGMTEALAAVAPAPGNLMAENLQARARGVILMALANASGAMVLNTGNKSEAAMGYSTMYGDSVGAVAVIGDLFKTEVYELARWRCHQNQIIPRNIFERPPTAELAPGQKDTDSLPPYAELDQALRKIMAFEPEVAENETLRTIRLRVARNAFKRRQSPPALLVSSLQPCPGMAEA